MSTTPIEEIPIYTLGRAGPEYIRYASSETASVVLPETPIIYQDIVLLEQQPAASDQANEEPAGNSHGANLVARALDPGAPAVGVPGHELGAVVGRLNDELGYDRARPLIEEMEQVQRAREAVVLLQDTTADTSRVTLTREMVEEAVHHLRDRDRHISGSFLGWPVPTPEPPLASAQARQVQMEKDRAHLLGLLVDSGRELLLMLPESARLEVYNVLLAWRGYFDDGDLYCWRTFRGGCYYERGPFGRTLQWCSLEGTLRALRESLPLARYADFARQAISLLERERDAP